MLNARDPSLKHQSARKPTASQRGLNPTPAGQPPAAPAPRHLSPPIRQQPLIASHTVAIVYGAIRFKLTSFWTALGPQTRDEALRTRPKDLAFQPQIPKKALGNPILNCIAINHLVSFFYFDFNALTWLKPVGGWVGGLFSSRSVNLLFPTRSVCGQIP